jgi:hypothetical protein
MKPSPNETVSSISPNFNPNTYEDTLRLIAHLPLPEGLVDRVQASLHSHPQLASHSPRVVSWPGAFMHGNGWRHHSLMRAAAAAAIVVVVAGGGGGCIRGFRTASRTGP